jgi:excisionase family DNA binding protein
MTDRNCLTVSTSHASARKGAQVRHETDPETLTHRNRGGEVITTTTTPDTPLLYTIPEAARALRISRTKLYELLSADEIESVYIGRSRKIPADALRKYVDQLRNRETD